MPGEPIIGIGDSLSVTECEKARSGILFSLFRSASHALQHDFGNAVVVNRLPLRDNSDSWETELAASGLSLCQAAGQTDWKRGDVFRFVAKDKGRPKPRPISFLLGLGWEGLIQSDINTISVYERQPIQYRFNPFNSYPYLDPNTVQLPGFTNWQIRRGEGGLTSGGSGFDFKVRSVPLAGGVMFTGGISGDGFISGVPLSESWIDADVNFEVYDAHGGIPPELIPVIYRNVVVTYLLYVS